MAAGAVEHDYHILKPSPWPLTGSIGAFVAALGLVIYMQGLAGPDADGAVAFWLGKGHMTVMLLGLGIVLFTMAAWWRDVIKESRAGDHTPVVQLGLRYGMLLFILSEVMFFAGWFWVFFEPAFFHDVRTTGAPGGFDTSNMLWNTPSTEFDDLAAFQQFPPKGVETINPWQLPLLNTLLLLTSGTTVTWAHHAVMEGKRGEAKLGLFLTIVLGLLFTALQAYEYYEAYHHDLKITTGLYGSAFYMATGFHGFHVIVGTIFLMVCFARLFVGHLTPSKHLGFEAAAWYWHFVDVVWLFLFAFVYIVFGGIGSAH